jgi:hypothetical protein
MPIQIHKCTPHLPSRDIGRHCPLILENHVEQQTTLHVSLWRFLCPNGHIRPMTRLENMPCDSSLLLRHSPEQNREEGIDGGYHGSHRWRYRSHGSAVHIQPIQQSF